MSSQDAWIGLATLTLLEIVLGIDNLIFISILTGKLPVEQRKKARQLGLGLAVITRIAFLFCIGLIMQLKTPLFHVGQIAITGHSLVLLLGGLFLMGKAVLEIHHKLEGEEHMGDAKSSKGGATMAAVVGQILMVDIIFSIDSVVTAVGMVKWIEVMIIAVLISVGIMLAFVNQISDFVERHPTIKMLALSFLILIGFTLMAEGVHYAIPKGYVYTAMGFSLLVEALNIRMRRPKTAPVQLRHNYPDEPGSETPQDLNPLSSDR